MTLDEMKRVLENALEERKIGNFENSNKLTETVRIELTLIKSSDKNYIEKLVQLNIIQGLNYNKLGNSELAIERCTEAIAYAEEFGFILQNANANNTLGLILNDICDYKKSLFHFGKAVNLNNEIGNKDGLGASTNNIGLVYLNISDFEKALEFFSKSLMIFEEIGNIRFKANAIMNIGKVYISISDNEKALEYYAKALYIYEEIADKNEIGGALNNIGNVYFQINNLEQALQYYYKALTLNEETGFRLNIAHSNSTIGSVYTKLKNFERALDFQNKALLIYEEIGNKSGIAGSTTNLGIIYKDIKDYKKALENFTKALKIYEEIGDISGEVTTKLNIGNIYAINESNYYDSKKAKEILFQAKSIAEEIGFKEAIKEIYQYLSLLSVNMDRYKDAYEFHLIATTLEKEILSEEANKQALQFDQRRKIEEDEKVRQLKLVRFKEQERIFHNILPISIADRLIDGEQTIAESFENVSIFFSDIVGFTTLSSIIEPAELVKGLNTIFTAFDRIGTKYGLEKIKTIGDAYMAVCGVPEVFEDHAQRAINFAIEAIEVLHTLELGEDFKNLQIRIGLHCGSVVAGIIGEKKFAYDVWGDAVNIASRMESNSEPGRIHISEAFAKSIEQHPEFNLIPRGEITIKGKGLMKTYWLEKAEKM